MAKVTFVPVQDSNDNSVNVPVNQLWNYQSGVPAATNDSSEGFAAGDLWVDSATDTMYVCSDASVNAAVWTAGGAPVGTIVAADYVGNHSLLVATTGGVPLPQVVAAGEFVGRAIAGSLGVVTAAQARAIIKATTEALFDDLASAGVIDGDRLKAGGITPNKNMVKAFTALGVGNVSPTAAQMVNGVLSHPAAAAQTLTTDTAPNIIANAAVGAVAGTYFEFLVSNTGAGTSTLTADGGATVTIVGDPAVLTGTTASFLAVVTGAATVSIFRK
jgi:hypothetical protein